jgi:tetratricopeptide (TPR) repeat protein
VAASQEPDAGRRVQLLLDAIAVRANRAEPFLPLFHSAFATGNYDLAATVYDRAWEKPPDADFTRKLATVYEKLGNLQRAIQLLEGADTKVYAAEIERLKKEQTARTVNAARRPHVSDAITQAGVVRPRVEP